MRITIAGYGNIGRFVQQVFSRVAETVAYDPPKGLGCAEDLRDTDFVFVCVPTPPLPNGECDTRAVEEVVALAAPRRAIICHSTVAIGTTERLIRTYAKPLVFVPEYAGESSEHPYRQMQNRDFFVLGGYEPAASAVKELLSSVYSHQPICYLVPPVVAEIVKYMENSFLALKVGFCNEFFDLCNAVGVDYDVVRSLWLQDHRVNPSHTEVTAERGYGGSCLPKDVASVCASARHLGSPMEIMEALQLANLRHRSTDDPPQPPPAKVNQCVL
ncbi:MAG: hypothetical protein O3A93_11440 [Chloroflexi bacterium]|nr:hypothetical protein [Chloroflexota bacterium]MDA1271852.1 hypothetical protein [Chloroflexota bacterium]